MSLDIVPKEDILNFDIKPYDPSGAASIAQKFKLTNYNNFDLWDEIFKWQDAHAQLISSLPDTSRRKILADFNNTKTVLEFYLDMDIIRIDKDDLVMAANGKQVVINKDNFFWKLHSNPDYLRKDTLNRFTQLYNSRDSIMAANTLNETGNSKSIVWAHNSHVIKPGVRMMGDYLNRILGRQYFNVITEYSEAGSIITFSPLQGMKKSPDPIASNTTIKELKRRYDIKEGIIFNDELVNKGYRRISIIEAGLEGTFGKSVIPANSFNALVILGQLYPIDVIEQEH